MKEKEIFHGSIFNLVKKDFNINGTLHSRDIIRHPGGVGLLCVQEGKILLVSQERQAIEKQTLEIPAGKLEYHEDPLKAGLRELNEETGYECKECRLIQKFYPTPGYSDEMIYIYECFDLSKAKHRLEMDEDENIQLVWMPLSEALEKAWNSEIQDAKTILAIYHAVLERRE